VEVRVSLIGANTALELESLADWLCGETELAGWVSMSGPRPREGELGALAEVLVVAVGSGGTLSVLAASLRAWLSQPHRSDVRIRVQADGGRVLDIAGDRVDAEALLRQALAFGMAEE
jgi:Effector Associated Constant Component 1